MIEAFLVDLDQCCQVLTSRTVLPYNCVWKGITHTSVFQSKGPCVLMDKQLMFMSVTDIMCSKYICLLIFFLHIALQVLLIAKIEAFFCSHRCGVR